MIRDTSAQDHPIEAGNGRRKRVVLIATLVGVVAIVALTAPSWRRLLSAEASVSASRLAFATVERGRFVRDIAADGRVVAAVSPTLYATSGGAVTLQVHAGDKVTRDEVLATIDSPELTNTLAQEQSALDALDVAWHQAQIDARKQRLELEKAVENAAIDETSARRDLERYRTAFAQGAFAKSDVDRAEDAWQKAKIALRHAREDQGLDADSLDFDVKAKKLARDRQQLRVKDVERQVAELQVRSPVDGQVGQLFIEPKATVAKDAKLLTVIDLSALEVEVSVPESFARDLAAGMPAEIRGNGTTWPGVVGAISPEVVNGEVAARVRFSGKQPADLRQNQRLSVRILLDQRDDVLTVTRGSFVDESGGRFAWRVKDGIATKTPIRLGASSIDKVEILQGLVPGDRIVISGTDNFHGATRVAIAK